MSAKHGKLVVKAGKDFVNYGKILKQMSKYVLDEKYPKEKRLEMILKKNNLLLAQAKRDSKNYNTKVEKLESYEMHSKMHTSILNNYAAAKEFAEKMIGIKSDNLTDYEFIIKRYDRKIKLMNQ